MPSNFFLLTSSFYLFFAQEVPSPDPARLSSWLVDAAALAAILLVFLKVIDEMDKLAAGLGDFSDHGKKGKGLRVKGKGTEG